METPQNLFGTAQADDGSEHEVIYDPSAGIYRVLNLRPSPKARMMAVPKGGPTLPMSEIRAYNSRPPQVKVKNQGQFGACNGHAAATGVEILRAVQGMPHVDLSAWYVYAILCNGVDRGSNISDALDLLTKDGDAPEANVPWGTINPRKLPADSRTAAPRFRSEIGTMLTNWEEIVSAVALMQPLNISIRVGSGFNNLDAEGVPPVARGAGNHAVCGTLGLKKSARWGWLILIQNSWDTSWGQDGYFWMAEAHMQNQAWFECYTLEAIKRDPTDPVPDAA